MSAFAIWAKLLSITAVEFSIGDILPVAPANKDAPRDNMDEILHCEEKLEDRAI